MLAVFVLGAWLLALINGVYVAPRAQAALGRLEDRLKGSQVSFEIQPRVFYEGFPKAVIYVQDVKNAQGAAVWKGVFMADLTDAANPRITLAKEGIVVSEGPDRLHLHLMDGSEHETDPRSCLGPLVLHRTSSPLRIADGVSSAGVGRHPAGALFQERR